MKNDIKKYILAAAAKSPHDIVKTTAKQFRITQQAVQKHIAQLMEEGKLRKEGHTRNTAYYLTTPSPLAAPTKLFAGAQAEWNYSVSEELSEQDIWDTTLKIQLGQIPQNIREIAEYGFTEMVNNVKDHSAATNLRIVYRIEDENLYIAVQDNGIGIFKKLKDTLGLTDLREAVLHLSKGKLTTDHSKHTGEGIFFSSRVFDKFFLSANGLIFGRINTQADEDWLLDQDTNVQPGTRVHMEIALDSNRTRDEIFRKFTSPEDFSFSKTHVAVELGLNEGETYVSRSQGKRILSNLDKFKFITLNFKRVKTVGQGFVDEVFRVFKNAHPDIEITAINTNENVAFMIKRSLHS